MTGHRPWSELADGLRRRLADRDAERQRIWTAIQAWTEVAHRLDGDGERVAVDGTEFQPLAPFFDELHAIVFPEEYLTDDEVRVQLNEADQENVTNDGSDDVRETIGQRLQRERVDRDMSQRELAELVGVGFPYISKIENDQETPSDGLLIQIAARLGLDADELILQAGRVPERYVKVLMTDPVRGLAHLRLAAHLMQDDGGAVGDRGALNPQPVGPSASAEQHISVGGASGREPSADRPLCEGSGVPVKGRSDVSQTPVPANLTGFCRACGRLVATADDNGRAMNHTAIFGGVRGH